MTTRRLSALLLAVAFGTSGCGLDALIISKATHKTHVVMPQPQDSVVVVYVDAGFFDGACAGDPVLTVLGGDGAELTEASVVSVTDEDGAFGHFEVHLPGTEAFRGALLRAQSGGQEAFSFIPEVPRQDSVLAPEKWYVFGEPGDGTLSLSAPSLAPIGLRTTAVTLALYQRLQDLGLQLSALPRATLVQAAVDLAADIEERPEGQALLGLVDHILACGAQLCDTPPFSFPVDEEGEPTDGYLHLDPAFLAAATGACGDLASLTSVSYLERVRAVSEGLTLAFDYADEAEDPSLRRIRVVFQVDLNADMSRLTRNCTVRDPAKWLDPNALADASRTMFIAGGVQADSPICGEGRSEYCLTVEQKSRINIALGGDADAGWQPNVTRMWDDGTHGDTTAGDGVYTLTVDVPYWRPEEAPDGAGVRLNYKYTWGAAGQIWTGAEEWPGNSRFLEVVDLTGDHLVIRSDIFGDETTNKDKQNILLPSKGGCDGRVLWQAQIDQSPADYEGCVMDSRENEIDTDGDCELDTWPTAPKVMPLVLE